MSNCLRIASWNINSVRARLDIVERYLREEAPDILCLQETKVTNDLFPEGPFRQLGYRHFAINGMPMHHGVAIISKVPLRHVERLDWQANGEARHVGVEIDGGVRINNVYIPAGGDIPDRDENPKFGQKLDFLARMTEWSAGLKDKTLLTGDFNVAPLEMDVWSHKQLRNVVSHTDIEIELLAKMQAAGHWVDLARHFVAPSERLYTWWSYRARDWEASDRGRRLDHMWVTPDLTATAKNHVVHKMCRSWGKPSDHAPIMTEFDF
ncbi:MAG: exodeoxyribonuclease III [Sphingomonadales bacterium]|nr:exodeoxyribonuclease III [Sphingomonadales bacterium]